MAMNESILLATDGGAGAAGAVRVAAALARTTGARLMVVTVVEPFALYGISTGYGWPVAEIEAEELRLDESHNHVRLQLRELAGEYGDAPLAVRVGAPPQMIVRCAEERKTSMIVLGLGGHRRVDRWFGSETALRVAQLARLPVLAVPEDARELPHRCLMAIDFSDTSLRAARSAGPLLATGAEVVLAHVGPITAESMGDVLPEWVRTYTTGTLARLEELGEELSRKQPIEARSEFLTGDPSQQLAEFAGREKVDLVVVGSQGQGLLGRMILGSVSSQLIRGVGCSVFVCPPAEAARPRRKAPRLARTVQAGSAGADLSVAAGPLPAPAEAGKQGS
jgi:nucleotide-binding universal stress UspA family protein